MRYLMLLCCFCLSIPGHAAPPTKAASRPAARAKAKPPKKKVFRYNPKTGVCENAKKEKGYNALDVKRLFGMTMAQAKATRFKKPTTYHKLDAECVDFGKLDFSVIIGLGYTVLSEWNLRGANFTGARFTFAKMKKVDLRGAKLHKLTIGYTTITGIIDGFTTLPKEGCKSTAIKGSSTKKLVTKKLRCRR